MSFAPAFPYRAPNGPEDSILIDIQKQHDELGVNAWEAVLRGDEPDPRNVEERHEMRERAAEILGRVVGFDERVDLKARYFYEEDINYETGKRLHYPLEYLYYVANIVGTISEEGVKEIPLRHPHPQQKGVVGFRLATQIEAVQVMGWHGTPAEKTMDIFVPVGELYLPGYIDDRTKTESLHLEQ